VAGRHGQIEAAARAVDMPLRLDNANSRSKSGLIPEGQEQLEIDRLRREVAKLKAERDILKKAAAYFAREPNLHVDFEQLRQCIT
jgi:transposase-like protein